MTNRHKIMVSNRLQGESNRMNNYAISSDGIAVALQDSASALTTAGNSMDEAVALVTAGE